MEAARDGINGGSRLCFAFCFAESEFDKYGKPGQGLKLNVFLQNSVKSRILTTVAYSSDVELCPQLYVFVSHF